MIKVGFIINFRKNSWLGGYNYFVNLFKCISLLKEQKIKPVIITDNVTEIKKDKVFKKYELVETNLVKRNNLFLRLIQKISLIFFCKNIFLYNLLKKKKIQILSHSETLGSRSDISSFPWFPDFQEINLPENFSTKDKILRRLNIILASMHSTKIIISTKSVQNDLKKISKKAFKKSFVIKHHAYIENKTKFLDLSTLSKKYGIKKNFFLVSNHYWKHKNHICILKALAELKKKKKNIQIISTGLFHDHRNPKYMNFITSYIKNNNLSDNYKILGIVPFSEMISLMFYSLAVINPSKSEGLSNSVEQAKSIGKAVILSNIPVHREQIEKNFFYFNPNDFKKLALLILKNSKNKKKNKKQNIIKIRKESLKKNLTFARKYQDFIIKSFR